MAITSVTKDTDAISYVEDGVTKKISISGSDTVVSFPIADCDRIINVWRQQSDGHLIISYFDTSGEKQEIEFDPAATGVGDMLKSTYDTNEDGVVEEAVEADTLDGEHAAAFEDAGAVVAHVAVADPHTGYRLESANHTHQTTGAQAGQLDHGAAMVAASLLDDDHTLYIKHSLATAVSDFLVASGAGVFIKKTLAEVKTVLGLGTAAYTAVTDYVTHALATAANDFIVASGSGVFIKKTLAETLTILGKAAASGLASLNASTKVVEQPAAITDHLEDAPTDAEVTKAPTSNFARDMKTLLDAHKTRHQDGGADEISIAGLAGLLADDQHVLDSEALAAAIAGGLSKLVAMASRVNVVLDYNRTTTLDFTDVDLTAVCSANAKFALLHMQIRVDTITAGAANYAYVEVRQNGTTVVDGVLWVSGTHHVAGSRDYNNVVVALDAGQVFEYTIVTAGTVQVDTFISVTIFTE